MQTINQFNQCISKLLWQKNMLILLLLTIVLLLSGCDTSLIKQDSDNSTSYLCHLSQSKQLSIAINQSQMVLSHSHCQMGYDDHFSTLVEIASGAPRDANLEILAGFSRWAYEQGIISKRQSEENLRRYFSTQLVSLDYHSDFMTYSHCSMSQNLSEIKSLLSQEIEQKRHGLAEALGNTTQYRLAVQEYQSITQLLEMTANACLQASR